jgi:hypothetical protein
MSQPTTLTCTWEGQPWVRAAGRDASLGCLSTWHPLGQPWSS